MNKAQLDEIVDAVLYEGYILYPYRASSKKNRRERFTFGRVYPESYSAFQNGAEICVMQTECLVRPTSEAVLKISVRFLQPMLREIGQLLAPVMNWNGIDAKFHLVPELKTREQLFQAWLEAVERRVEIPSLTLKEGMDFEHRKMASFSFPATRRLEPIREGQSPVVGVVVRSQPEIKGYVEVSVRSIRANVFKLTVRITNQTAITQQELKDPEAVLLRTLASTHTLLSVEHGKFISLMDPGEGFKEAARECKNIGTWPVLVGDETQQKRDTLLSSPIILYDFPKIAPESAGSMFDGAEIDEILTLRVQTLTEDEKLEIRSVDEHARRLLERTDALTPEAFQRLHGVLKNTASNEPVEFDDFFGATARLEGATVDGVHIKTGDRVRIRPKARADVMDMALAGQIAIVEAVEQDLEKRIHLALVLENDPGRDLGMMRQPGHRFFYALDEVEPLVEETR